MDQDVRRPQAGPRGAGSDSHDGGDDAGRPGDLLHTALRNDPKSKVIFTGYLVEDTPGRRLLEEGIFEADGYEFRTELKVERFDFSAHAGRSELFEIVRRVNPSHVVVVHGDEENALRLAEELNEQEGVRAFAPRLGERIDISLR
ncbi:TPA: MBL fold metallo-hydrolase [Candidatus Micrarchaeota archaeon]|nr:MBL fold metallo-hydrolase [Candidatus Micrarchaeota archaeon]